MSGSLHMMKGEESAKRLSDEEFARVAVWIDRFKLSHMVFGKMRGESKDVKGDTKAKWRTVVWPSVCVEDM